MNSFQEIVKKVEYKHRLQTKVNFKFRFQESNEPQPT